MPSAASAAKGKAGRAAPAAKTTTTNKAKSPSKSAAKPAAKPMPAAKAAAKPAPATKAAAPAKARKAVMPKFDPAQRQHYVEVAAYYIAERRGFLGGCETEDWNQAEREIDNLLREGKLSV